MISIITASYNYEKYIKEAIESVLNQTCQDWELIIVDDCSFDNSCNIIESFNDPRIKLIKNEKNLGLKLTLQKGLEQAKGSYIAFLESDDLWRNDYLEKKLEIIKKYANAGLIFNDVELFGEGKNFQQFSKVAEINNKFLEKKTFPCNIFGDLNYTNRILTFSSVLIKKEILQNINFNSPVDKLLDWWLYIHITYDNDVYYIQEKLTKWRIHPNSYISDKKQKKHRLVHIEAYFDMYKKTRDIQILFLIQLAIFKTFLYRIKKRLFYHRIIS